jgi:hypothetical protein
LRSSKALERIIREGSDAHPAGPRERTNNAIALARCPLGLADRGRDLAAIGDSAAFCVESSEREIEIALDGEVRRMKLPAKFAVDPGGLKVVVPKSQASHRRDGSFPARQR